VVNPCIPPGWKGFKISRKFRGKTYKIDVRNPRGVSKGVQRMSVDGQTIDGNTIPLNLGGSVVNVQVVLE
jgi:cellobiose phosphorylase